MDEGKYRSELRYMMQSEIAQVKSAINPRVMLAHDYEDYFVSKVSSAKRIAETVEIFREDTAASVITFHEKIEPSKPIVRRNRASTKRGKVSDKKTVAERARAGRLLGSLAKLYATRSPALFLSRHRVALLTIAGNLLAIVAAHDNRELEPANLQWWARKNVDGATAAEVEQAFEAALKEYRAVPAPSAVGFTLELSKYHWLRAGRPWGVHPADLTADDVEDVQREAKRHRDRQRAAAKRAASGSTPRGLSVAAIARKLGVSRPTLYKRMRNAGFDDASAFYTFVARTNKKKYRGDDCVNSNRHMPEAGGPKAAAAQPATGSPRSSVVRVRDGLIAQTVNVRAASEAVKGIAEPAPRAPGGHFTFNLTAERIGMMVHSGDTQ